MSIKDFISKLPLDTIIKTEILDNKITLPAVINPVDFYSEFSAEIKAASLTTEKALFVCSMVEETGFKSSRDLLNSRLTFN